MARYNAICDYVKDSENCSHSAEDIKQYEIEITWENYDWEDPSAEHRVWEDYNYDLKRNMYHRTYDQERQEKEATKHLMYYTGKGYSSEELSFKTIWKTI